MVESSDPTELYKKNPLAKSLDRFATWLHTKVPIMSAVTFVDEFLAVASILTCCLFYGLGRNEERKGCVHLALPSSGYSLTFPCSLCSLQYSWSQPWEWKHASFSPKLASSSWESIFAGAPLHETTLTWKDVVVDAH